MARISIRLRGVGKTLWHAKHMFIHIVLGFMWAWLLEGAWDEMSYRWVMASVIGSMLPDLDHILYFFTYGKKDPYTKTIFSFIKKREWNVLVTYIEQGHKHNTNLTFHNVYAVGALAACAGAFYLYDYRAGVVLLGSMVLHFLFDIAEDLWLLGAVNKNWLRFGRPKKYLRT